MINFLNCKHISINPSEVTFLWGHYRGGLSEEWRKVQGKSFFPYYTGNGIVLAIERNESQTQAETKMTLHIYC